MNEDKQSLQEQPLTGPLQNPTKITPLQTSTPTEAYRSQGMGKS